MAEAVSQERPLTLDDLTAYFAQGSKPKEQFRVGAEHEKFGFYLKDHAPVPYEGDKGVHALLTGLQRFGWKPVMEGDGRSSGWSATAPMSAWSRAASSSFPARPC